MPTLADLRASALGAMYGSPIQYWGPEKLCTADGKASDMRDRLIKSIVNAFKTPNTSSVNCGGFATLINYFSLPDLDFNEVVVDSLHTFDRIVLEYFVAMEIDHTTVDVDGRNVPVTAARGICYFVMMHLCTNPEATGKALNALLQNKEYPLLDPLTDKPFGYTSIPDSVLPEPRSDFKQLLDHYETTWNTKKAELIKQIKEGHSFEGDALRVNIEKQGQISQNIQQQRSLNTAQNLNAMSMSSTQASLAAWGSYNNALNAAKQSWGNF